MASLYEQLRIGSAKHGAFMEEEARQIIGQVVSAPEKIISIFKKYFGSENGINLDIPEQRKPHNPMGFDE